mmetsp:Transcript_1735/g.5694  ORF Transcript_1735/g.5694 Transcript_1735/m.5694 type:complete len:143 (-) Transcript_1735:109-537(-)
MKPAWDQLGAEYASSNSVIVGDVDCTTDGGKPVCDANEVRGYPTIKYFTAETGDTGASYSGARSHDALKKFVEEHLAAKCLVEDRAACSEKEVGYIDKMAAADKEEVGKQLERLKGMKANSMAPDLKAWLNQRIAILEQLAK